MSLKLPAFLSYNDNEAAKSTATLAATSEDSIYPASNLKLERITKAWRSAAAALSNVDVTIDCGSAKSVNFLAVGNHNLTSAATVTVFAGTTSGASDFSQVLTWRQFDMFAYLSTTKTYRYWIFRFTDASNPDNFIEAGSVVMGLATVLVTPFSYDWLLTDEFMNQDAGSQFGVSNINELFYRVRVQIAFNNKPTTEIDTLRTIFKAAKQNVTPVWFVPDTTGLDAFYMRFSTPFPRKWGFKHSVALGLVEESRGNKIAA